MTLETQEKRQVFVQFNRFLLVGGGLKFSCCFLFNYYFRVVHTTVADFDGVYAEIKSGKVSLTNYSDVPNRLVCPSSLVSNPK